MADIRLYGLESLEVARSDEYPYPLIVTIKGEDGTTVRVHCDHSNEAAEELRNVFQDAEHAMDAILADWEDTPEEDDGYVAFNRGKYSMSLGCKHLGSFPSQDIAEVELVEAMAEAGFYPNCWFENDRGNREPLDNSLASLTDENGGLKPLHGVEYEPDAEVLADGYPAYVIRDYGDLGLIYTLRGDDYQRFADDRSIIAPAEDEEDA